MRERGGVRGEGIGERRRVTIKVFYKFHIIAHESTDTFRTIAGDIAM